MAENNNDLEMGLFGMDTDLELNLGYNPDEDTTEDPAETPEQQDNVLDIPGQPGEDTPEQPDNINPTEDEDPENVGGDEDPEGDDATSPNLFSSFASELHSKGVLPSLDLESTKIEDTDSLATVIKGEIDTQAKAYIISKIGEQGFDALEKGVSLAQYQEHTNTVQQLDNITDDVLEDDLELSKRVVLQDYINQGLTEQRAKHILQKSIDLGEDSLIEDAKQSIVSLKAYENLRIEQEKINASQRQAEAVQAQEKIDNDLKQAIYSKKAFIEGLEVNKTIQDKVYKAITQVVGESPDGVMENQLMKDRRENPVDFDAKLYYLYELTGGFKDFSKITTKATSRAASDFERALRQTKFESGGNPTYVDDANSYDGSFGTELVL